jgi:hypothetical protein
MTERQRIQDILKPRVVFRATIQRDRIRASNRLSALNRQKGFLSDQEREMMTPWFDRVETIWTNHHNRLIEQETQMDEELRDLAGDFRIVREMTALRGAGLLLAAKVIGLIDIEKAETVSKLWRYAGYGLTAKGIIDRRTKGETMKYNQGLKTSCRVLTVSMMRSNSPYRAVYDEAREVYAARPDWSAGHQHSAALRKMTKIWLAHLWNVWRTLEGLPAQAPYIFHDPRHTHQIMPTDMGWQVEIRAVREPPVQPQ